MLTDVQREKINEAFDILCDVYKELEPKKTSRRLLKRLDTILGKIENLLWMK